MKYGKIYTYENRNEAKIGIGDSEDEKKITEAWNHRHNPWHTGTPTEEGWYLVAYECVHGCKNKGKLEYYTMHIFEDELGYKDIRGRASDDVWKAIAWQRIEPYKEKEDVYKG